MAYEQLTLCCQKPICIHIQSVSSNLQALLVCRRSQTQVSAQITDILHGTMFSVEPYHPCSQTI